MSLRCPAIVWLILCTSLLLTACSRQSLFDTALRFERASSGLVADSIEVQGLTIAYLRNAEASTGAPLVMIHGFGANKDNWTRLADQLSDDFRVFAIDLPGHGDSSKPLDLDYSLTAQTERLADILEALGIAKAHLMGNSMGGAITALYAANYPQRTNSAVLFNPSGIFKYPSELGQRLAAGDNPLIPAKPGDYERLVNFALEQKPFLPWPIMSVLEEKALANRTVNETIFASLNNRDLEAQFQATITQITSPVLVIWGKQDRLINYRNGAVFVSAIATAQLTLLDDIGHAPMIEAPDISARLFRDFIGSADRRP